MKPLAALRELNRRRLALRRERAHTRRYTEGVAKYFRLHAETPLGPLEPLARPTPSFLHSGHAGDLIYSLPAARTLANGRPLRLYLKVGVDANGLINHPLGNVRLNPEMIAHLLPLLRSQRYIADAAQHDGQPIDLVLDAFRDAPVDTQRGNIARWYCATYAISLDLGEPWLEAQPMPGLSDVVVVARSARYRNPALDYRFLKAFPRLAFVGLESEFQDMRATLPAIEFLRTDNYLQLAQVIQGSLMFIGNQSSPYAVAEGLKVRRVLEVFSKLPNVMPEGLHGYEAWMQPQFEQAVRRCLDA